MIATALLLALPAAAQDGRDAQRKLEKIQSELKAVASERRQLEGQRGSASRQLRDVDEKVGQSSRGLLETQARLAREQAALAELTRRRATVGTDIAARRGELAQLLRSAYLQSPNGPLKALLSQDRVADSARLLTYHGYVQRDRAARIATLTAQLRELDDVQRQIGQRQQQLDRERVQQQQQVGQLRNDRDVRAALVAQIDQRYQDRKAREQALGRDAKGLQKLLQKLRVAAAREAKRRAAAAAREARVARTPNPDRPRGAGKPRSAPRTPAMQVGGLGWPVSGALLAGFGAAMPDGRSSDGLLIGASAGSPVKAVANGQVVYAEWMTGYGLLLIVDHGNGYMSLYAHNDGLLKDVGANVSRGEAVATVGNSGGQGQPALYFELRREGRPVDPGTWLRR